MLIVKNVLANATVTESTVTSFLGVQRRAPNCDKKGFSLNSPTEVTHPSGSLQSCIYVVLKCSEVEILAADIHRQI